MYKDEVINLEQPRLEYIIQICKGLVPRQYNNCPWKHPEINHGIGILHTEDGLNCYIASYGDAHIRKVQKAIEMMDIATFNSPFEVVDWGCGQGIASLCLIEYLREKELLGNLKTIRLIEPGIAIERAAFNIKRFAPHVEVIKYQVGLPATCLLPFPSIDRLSVRESTVVHFFSNILDIATIDLKEVAQLVASTSVRHFVSCIGPAQLQEQRINAFCRYFSTETTTFSPVFRDTEFYKSKTFNNHTFGCFIRNFSFTREQDEPILIPYKFYPPKQFFAGYKSDLLASSSSENEVFHSDTAFEVLAPFDFGASVYEDVHPIWAVINNIIVRGLPTKTSPWLESVFVHEFGISKEYIYLGTINYQLIPGVAVSENIWSLIKGVPLAVARLQKVIVEAVLTGTLELKDHWNILVKENDVPCAALAIEELKQMYNNLTSLSRDYAELKFPEISLNVINEQYTSSGLHLNANVQSYVDANITAQEYDLVVDIAINEVCNPQDVVFSEFNATNNCYFNVRSSELIYEDRYIYTTDRIVYNPLTTINAQGVHEIITEQANRLKYFLQLLFRKQDFRDGQLPIMSRAMQLKSVIGLLPTGGGKSLTYQIAAMLQPGVSIVVDPLVSLMKDQYDGLLKCGIDVCTYINSTVRDRASREKEMKESKKLFIFLSPERMTIFRFRQSLRSMRDNHVYFAYGVIDEVHCVSEWGHDFRFSYLHLGRNLYQYVLPKQTGDDDLNHITLMGLTATASFDVLADVERELSGDAAFPLDPQSTVRYENTNRLELQYRIIKVNADSARSKWDVYAEKNRMVPDVVRDTFYESITELQSPDVVANIKQRFIERENIDPDCEYAHRVMDTNLSVDVTPNWYSDDANSSSAIIFCPHRKGYLGVNNSGPRPGVAQQVMDGLGIRNVSTYCGGDSLTAQDEFINGDTNIMVATKAFGMGIDKPNVRLTLNMNHSGSLEAYIQEAGRAGRDRKMALSIILYSDKVFNDQDSHTRIMEPVPVDFGVHKFFHDGNFIGPEFEKWVMYYLMTQQATSLAEVDEETHRDETVRGFLSRMEEATSGDSIVYYISYRYPSDDSTQLQQKKIFSRKFKLCFYRNLLIYNTCTLSQAFKTRL